MSNLFNNLVFFLAGIWWVYAIYVRFSKTGKVCGGDYIGDGDEDGDDMSVILVE